MSKDLAMVVPFRIVKTYGKELYWWKPLPEAKGYVATKDGTMVRSCFIAFGTGGLLCTSEIDIGVNF